MSNHEYYYSLLGGRRSLPSVVTSPPLIISGTVFFSGEVTYSGGCLVTGGFVVSTSPQPTVGAPGTTVYDTIDGVGIMNEAAGLPSSTTLYVRAYAVNCVGTVYGQEFSVFDPFSLPTVSTTFVYPTCNRVASITGNITNNGGCAIIEKGVRYSTSPMTIFNSFAGTDIISTDTANVFTVTTPTLAYNTTYYARAWARNCSSLNPLSAGNGLQFGNEITFTTGPAPSVTHSVSYTICQTDATLNGDTTWPCIINEKGFYWGTTPTPNNILSLGPGAGPWSFVLTGLQRGSTYYTRSYMISGVDFSTVFSPISSFTVTDRPNVDSTSPVTTGPTTASVTVNVLTDGGCPVTSRGIVYCPQSVSFSPTVGAGGVTTVTLGSGVGTFPANLTGLTAGVTYSYRAWASNAMGIVYSQIIYFQLSNIYNLTWTTELRAGTPPAVVTTPPAECPDMGWVLSNGNRTIRFNVSNSLASNDPGDPPCIGTCNVVQAGSALANIQVGTSPVTFSLDFTGFGEREAPFNFEKIDFYLNPVSITTMNTNGRERIGGAASPGGGLGCAPGGPVVKNFVTSPAVPWSTAPYNASVSLANVYSLTMPAGSVWSLFIDFTTGDNLYHTNCFYEVNLSFT